MARPAQSLAVAAPPKIGRSAPAADISEEVKTPARVRGGGRSLESIRRAAVFDGRKARPRGHRQLEPCE